ncbi:MAG: hypothetical protein QHG99_09060 [Methanomicrobiales archaeon]|nr:hypothetical protein [Methanomicrobiales archaeon]
MRETGELSGQCVRCGRCCERWGWSLDGSVEDLNLWLNLGRRDILKHVTVIFIDGRTTSGDRITMEEIPGIVSIRLWRGTDGVGVKKCPFFQA